METIHLDGRNLLSGPHKTTPIYYTLDAAAVYSDVRINATTKVEVVCIDFSVYVSSPGMDTHSH